MKTKDYFDGKGMDDISYEAEDLFVRKLDYQTPYTDLPPWQVRRISIDEFPKHVKYHQHEGEVVLQFAGSVEVDTGNIVIIDPIAFEEDLECRYVPEILYDPSIIPEEARSIDDWGQVAKGFGFVSHTAFGNDTYPIYRLTVNGHLLGIFVDLQNSMSIGLASEQKPYKQKLEDRWGNARVNFRRYMTNAYPRLRRNEDGD